MKTKIQNFFTRAVFALAMLLTLSLQLSTVFAGPPVTQVSAGTVHSLFSSRMAAFGQWGGTDAASLATARSIINTSPNRS